MNISNNPVLDDASEVFYNDMLDEAYRLKLPNGKTSEMTQEQIASWQILHTKYHWRMFKITMDSLGLSKVKNIREYL